MKAKELMIGDLVYDKMLKRYGKIEVLTPFTIQCDIHTDTHHIDFFEPVPLTPEILEKNGFSLERDGAYTYYDDVHIPEQQYIAVLFRHNLTARHIEIKRMR